MFAINDPTKKKSKDAVTVLQHEYAIITEKSNYYVLNTIGAGPCVIMALYDCKYKIALLAHIDIQTDIDSLAEIISPLSKNHTIAYLAGGDFDSARFNIMRIIYFLLEENIPIVKMDIGKSSLSIDVRTGKSVAPIDDTQISEECDLHTRFKMGPPSTFSSTPLRRIKIPSQISETANKQPIDSYKKVQKTNDLFFYKLISSNNLRLFDKFYFVVESDCCKQIERKL